MTIIVMLSHPTPPVSLFEAKQLSIIFSEIFESSCFAAMPRLTNSTTACEDWQSQIPEKTNQQNPARQVAAPFTHRHRL